MYMYFIYCELNWFIFLKSLWLFLSDLIFNSFQCFSNYKISVLFKFFRNSRRTYNGKSSRKESTFGKQTWLLLRDRLYHALPKRCHVSRESSQEQVLFCFIDSGVSDPFFHLKKKLKRLLKSLLSNPNEKFDKM